MLNRYVTAALRVLRRQKGTAAINGFGLAVGVASILCIYALVSHELRFDAFHAQAERTYRVGAFWPEWDEDGASYQAQTPTGLVPVLREGVAGVARAADVDAGYGTRSVKAAGRFFDQDGVAFVGPDYFEVFDYAVVAGGTERLDEPDTVVLTETTARRFFGGGAAVGETVRYGDDQDLEVVGVVADPPAETHLAASFFASLATRAPAYDEWGFSDGHSVYLVLEPGASPAEVARRLNAVRVSHQSAEQRAAQRFVLQPLRDIHTDTRYGAAPGSYVMDPVSLWGLGLVGALVLLLAVVNYVNLATAQGVARAREIGVRKAIGGTRGQIAAQVLSETAVLTGGAVAVGWLAALALLPSAAGVFEIELSRIALLRPEALLFVVAVAVVVSGLAGFYPAVVLSGYRPSAVLRGASGGRRVGGVAFRRGLVVFQFAATASLLLGTFVVLQQMRYVQGKDLGFEREARLLVRVPDGEPARARFREAVRRLPSARTVTYAMGGPAKDGRLSQRYTWDGADDAQSLRTVPVDAAYAETFGLRLLAGRPLRAGDEVQPHSRVVLVNRALSERMGYGQPGDAVGALIRGAGGADGLGPLRVVGVVEDFHHGSLHSEIDPAVLLYWPQWTHWAGIALAPDAGAGGLSEVEAAFEATFPDTHFRYAFLDDYLAGLYTAERRVANAFRVFAGLAVLIACLGLLGMAALTAAQRTREIGVRKVLGASVASLVALLSREVVVLVAVAFAVAAPPAWVLMRRWLDGFAYHVDLGPVPFLAAGALLLAVALATVGAQALRAATADPIRALRSE
ncbi:ABC transporter permease [Rubrivirga sp. S365]|uniref:ABC transporter permease n=1 Tax=Rubrivirga sp. S365 TaxID=3076080 RepID=UPI0028C9C9A8|nr:ABC transporter permease [Rubrivirga sp. S365]MDT7856756.1 ABC transporter permease [Rubrivirga sp. S365]